MKFNKNLVSFITGGASGLGEATLRRFLKQGVKVAVADLNE
jgi:NAD(P)-dependent dehydrogenase (short-subunit alcohol dehydrogenase family)